jgi:hypothetical protein
LKGANDSACAAPAASAAAIRMERLIEIER